MNVCKKGFLIISTIIFSSFIMVVDGFTQGKMDGNIDERNNRFALNDNGPGHRYRHGKYGRRFGPPGRHHRRHGRRHSLLFGDRKFLKERLKLSESQIDKMSKINIRFKKRHLALREKLAPLKIRLRRMLLENEINIRDIRRQLKKISNIKIEIKILRIKHRLAIEKILTPKQRRILKDERMHHRRHKRHRRHRGRGHDRF